MSHPESMTAPPPAIPPRWQTLWDRWKHLVAAGSFGLGIASFLLFERAERVAQVLVVMLPLGWLLALAERPLRRLARRWPRLQMSPVLLGFAAQALHQECLFFTLPFFFLTTAWLSPQLAFTALMCGLALVSIIDPLYYRQVAGRPAGLWAFHALTSAVTVLTAAPMLWHLSTGQSLSLALLCLGAVSVPAWRALLPPFPLSFVVALLLGAGTVWAGWQLRVAIPPATLWVSQMTMAHTVDTAGRVPGPGFAEVSAEALHAGGAYAWSSIHVPRGLRERVEHHWLHEGRTVDVIGLEIRGGREAGYRAWSRKTAFPADPRGRWDVRVVTQSGQLIGQIRFVVR